jgi:hypothetical protein
MKKDIPRYNCDLDITDDDVHETEKKPHEPEDDEDPDAEDCSKEIAELHSSLLIPTNTSQRNRLTSKKFAICCSARASLTSYNSWEGDLVFPKYKRDLDIVAVTNRDAFRVQNITRWMIEIIDAVALLHARGIVHCDLVMRNILDAEPLVICDLQCLNASGHCRAFELDSGDRNQFSFASDVFALGTLLWSLCFFNYPALRAVLLDHPPPPPFREIFFACTQKEPKDRPTLESLRSMYEAIQ